MGYILILTSLAITLSAGLAHALDAKTFEFDCSNKQDGNYPHPTLCTHYVQCYSQKYAYDMECPLGANGQQQHFVQNSGPSLVTSRCDSPDKAGCVGNNLPTTTATTPTTTTTMRTTSRPTPTSTTPQITHSTTTGTTRPPPTTTPLPPHNDTYTPPELPVEGSPCAPHKCVMVGYCHGFFACNEHTHKWEHHDCDQDLYWNERASNGAVYGGSCDFLSNIPVPIQDAYFGDEHCIPKCKWWQKEEEQCTGQYHYTTPFDKETLQSRNLTLQCPVDVKTHEALIWVQSSLSCQHCKHATDLKNHPCKC